ncbi:MAG: glycosyltransferase family 1 protein [Bacteroidales bacterium]
MIIGLDGKRAVSNLTGLGNYSRFIISALNTQFPGNSYKIFAPKKRVNRELDEILRPNTQILYPENIIAKAFPTLWRSNLITNDLIHEQIDIYHGLSNEIPIGIEKSGIKSVVTIHDLIFLRYPQYYKPIDRKIYNYKFHRACQTADHIIAISECTKRDIINFYNIPDNKIDVVYQGCHPQFTVPASEEIRHNVRRIYNLPNRYILFVGTIEQRKNLMLLVRAIKLLPKEIHLVAIGRKTPYAEEVTAYCQKQQLTKRVHIIQSVPFHHLPALYQQAEVFAYPSRFEGFGIPIIEAINSHIPVLATTGSCLEEAGGNGALYVNPDDAETASEAINRIITDNRQRNSLIAAGEEQIKKFAPDVIASGINDVYRKVLRCSL